jgi:M6 family metalloprotease-like protein
VWMNCLSRFSQSIPCLLFSVLLLTTSGDVSRGQEQSDSGALAERVRSFNRELLSSSPAPVSSILAQRAARMFELMESDPRAAIRLSLSAAQAARLSVVSPDATGSIESQGEWHGALTVVVEDDFSRGTSRQRYWIETGGVRVEVYFADHPGGLSSGHTVSVRGIRLGKRIAADLTSISPDAAANSCGPIGEEKTAVLMLEFPGVPFPYSLVTPSELHDMYFSSSKPSLDGYLREASYGKTFATGDVFGPFMLDQNYDYATQQPDGLFAAIRAVDPTLDLTIYNHLVLIWPAPEVSGVGELSCEHLSTPSRGDFIGTYVIIGVGTFEQYPVALAAHEAGHNLGLNHASSLDYAPLTLGPPGVDGVHQEYGDPFSIMGGGGEGEAFLAHFNAPHKAQLGWLDPASVLNVESDGTFLLQPLESPAGLRALRVRRGSAGDEWLWLEYRQPIGYDAGLAGVGDQQFSGALIHLEEPALSQQRPDYTFLLDFTPNTPHVFSDAALAAGQAWSDPYGSLTVGVTTAGPTGLGIAVTYSTPCATLNPASHSHGSGAETGAFAITAPATCSWTATSNTSWITITGPQSGMGSGTVSYAVSANSVPTRIGTATLRTGSILAGFQTFTITQASSIANQPPSLDWVSPNSGAGNSQTFTFAASDPNGAVNLRSIDVDFVRFGSNTFVCQVSYVIGSFTEANGAFAQAGSLFLLNDDQTTVTGPYTVGVANVALQNSQCGVDVSGVTVTSSGNSVEVSFPMVFFGSGTWSIQVNLYNYNKIDVGGVEGSWTVPESGCSYSLGPAGASAGKNGTAGTIAIAAGSGCPRLASASAT